MLIIFFLYVTTYIYFKHLYEILFFILLTNDCCGYRDFVKRLKYSMKICATFDTGHHTL